MSVVTFPPQNPTKCMLLLWYPTRVTVNRSVQLMGCDGQQMVVELLAVKVVT